jgi:signal transduction histidine kinase
MFQEIRQRELIQSYLMRAGHVVPEPKVETKTDFSIEEFLVHLFDVVSTITDELSDRHGHRLDAIISAPVKSVRRVFVKDSHWCLSLRAQENRVIAFFIPAADLSNLTNAETPARAKLTFQCEPEGTWSVDGFVLGERDLVLLLKALIRDLLNRSAREALDADPLSLPVNLASESVVRYVKALAHQNQTLASKIVKQQEHLQKSVSENLHDIVIPNLVHIRQSLEKSDSCAVDTIKLVDETLMQLRAACYELVPRDLYEIGLVAVLEESIERLNNRGSMSAILKCTVELPQWPIDVETQVFRIISEALHNAEKHAEAKNLTLTIFRAENAYVFEVADDGVGLVQHHADSMRRQGQGLLIQRERVEYIRAIVPCELEFNTNGERGTRVTLRLRMRNSSG